jgi:phage terminase large subunit-like protein
MYQPADLGKRYWKLIQYVPHTIQKRLHKNDRKIRAYFGGNRSGKTTFGAVETLWWCLGMHRYRDDIPEPPIRARVCCTDFINGIKKIILPEFQKWLPEGSYHWHAEDRVLELENGSKIEMLCLSEDTEVLTDEGWKLFKDLNRNEEVMTVNLQTGDLEWQKPTAYYSYDFKGHMIHIKTQAVDCVVTPTHNMLVSKESKKDKSTLTLKPVVCLAKKDKAPMSFGWNGEDTDYFVLPLTKPLAIPMEDWCAFMGMYLSEGHARRGTVSISQYPGPKRDTMREALKKFPLFNGKENKKSLFIFNSDLVRYLQKFGLSGDKYIPSEIKNLNKEYLQIFVDFLMLGDGSDYTHESGYSQKNYTSKSKRLIDDLQEVLLRLGINSSIYCLPDCGCYRLRFLKRNKTHLVHCNHTKGSDARKPIHYEGKVYCVNTPNHTLVSRRNGRVLATGNSYDQDVAKYGGVSRHLIWMDEEPTYKALYDENMMRTVDIGGSMMLTMTPIKGLTWVYDEVYEAGNPDHVYYEVATIYDNPHLNRDEIKIIEDTMHPDEREVRLEGRFIPKSGLIYKEFDTKLHVVPYFKIPDDWTIVLGIDPHDRTPHAVVFCAINRDHDIFIFDEIFESCLIKDLAAKMRMKLGFVNPMARRKGIKLNPAYSVIDTSAKTPDMISGKNYKEELGLGHGFFCVDAHKDVIAGISKVREYLNYSNKKPNIYVMEHCREMIHQFRHYIWDDYVKKDRYNLKERPLKKDDHLLDALRYVLMTNPRWQIPNTMKKRVPKYKPLYESTGF